MQLLDVEASFHESADGLFIKHSQAIPQEFLDECRAGRHATTAGRLGDMHHVAAVPTSVVELWLRQGFDIHRESARAIVKRLRDHGLEAFLTTNKRV